MTHFTLVDFELFIETEMALTEAVSDLENSTSNYIWN
jgi:hypothetical protein